MKKLILGGATTLLILVGGAFAYRATHTSKFRPDCPDCPDCPGSVTCPLSGEQVSRSHCPFVEKHAETPACCKQTPAQPE